MEFTGERGSRLCHVVEIQYILCFVSTGDHERVCTDMECEFNRGENHITCFLGCPRIICARQLCALYTYDVAEKEGYEGQGGGRKGRVSCW